MHVRPFRFALTVGHATDRETLVQLVLRAEDAGFAVLAGVDHVGDSLGVMPMLAALAEVTTLRLSPMVLANDHRHPALLARDAATLDVLSGGRFELGIGTGWIKAQYDAIGIPLDDPGVRVERLGEALAVIKGCWSARPFSFVGKHYRVDLVGAPAPIQRPHPPLLVAGSGPRMLRLAGTEGDIVSITVTCGLTGFESFADAVVTSASNLDRQLGWIADGAGPRLDEIELNTMIHLLTDSDGQLDALARAAGVDASVARRSPHVLSGSTEQMMGALQERRERWGISYITVRGAHLDAMEPVVWRLAGT